MWLSADQIPTLVYVQSLQVYTTVANDGIVGPFIEAGRGKPDPEATVVRGLAVHTDGRCGVLDDLLYLDGLALLNVMVWARQTSGHRTDKAIGKRFMRAFVEDMAVTSALHAVLRVVLNLEHKAFGESGYFCSLQWRQHPQEFAKLRAFAAANLADH